MAFQHMRFATRCGLLLLASTAFAQADTPKLQVQPARWDLGKVDAGRYQQVFEVTNAGGGALTIDELRVSSPQRMNATIAPLGTEVGKRFQLTVVVSTDGLDAPFAGYVVVHSNDKDHPDVKIDVTAERAAPSGGLLVFYTEEGTAIAKLRERVAALPKVVPGEVLFAGDLANLSRLRALEKDHGVTQGGAFEMFRGAEACVAPDATAAMAAIERVAQGKALSGREAVPHEHGTAPPAPATVATLLPPPLVVDLFIDASCEACSKALQQGAEALVKAWPGRVGLRPHDLSQPDAVKGLRDAIPAKDLPPATHAIAVVGGTYLAGEVKEIFAALPRVIDEALAKSAAAVEVRSPAYTNEMRLGGPAAPSIGPAAPSSAPSKPADDDDKPIWLEVGSPLALWLLILIVAFFQCLMAVRMGKLLKKEKGA